MVLEKEWIRDQLCSSWHELSEYASTLQDGKFRSEIELILPFLQDASSDRFEEVFSGLNELEVMEWDYRFAELMHLWRLELVGFND